MLAIFLTRADDHRQSARNALTPRVGRFGLKLSAGSYFAPRRSYSRCALASRKTLRHELFFAAQFASSRSRSRLKLTPVAVPAPLRSIRVFFTAPSTDPAS